MGCFFGRRVSKIPDIVTTRIFSDGEKQITAQKLNDIVASSQIQTSFVSSKPVASSIATNDNLLLLTAGGTYAQAAFQKVIDGVSASQGDSEIWSVRLRSFNAIGNPNFEVDQRQCHATIASLPAGSSIIPDRWLVQKSAASTYAASAVSGVQTLANTVVVPNTNFGISNSVLRITLTTAQASLAATDYMMITQQIEGNLWRELSMDVHSVSLLVKTSVAGLKFGVSIRDPGSTTKSLTKLCTLTSANVWTLITLPNLPVFPAGNFVNTPGALGYILSICLGAGSTNTSPANDTWQNGTFYGAIGQSNFAGSAVNSTFDVAFVQHEPGAVCSTFIDKPFLTNYDECLRYYCKSYQYSVKPGTATSPGAVNAMIPASQSPWLHIPFKKIMATLPTITAYSPATGASANVRDGSASLDKAVTSSVTIGDASFGGWSITGANAAVWQVQGHYTADTAW